VDKNVFGKWVQHIISKLFREKSEKKKIRIKIVPFWKKTGKKIKGKKLFCLGPNKKKPAGLS
jgi:hypothetical protein